MHYDALRRLAGKALAAGGTIHGTEVRWICSGQCSSPVTREVYVRPSDRGYKNILVRVGRHRGIRSVLMTVKCRKCDHCMKLRGREWIYRAKSEFALSGLSGGRVWFGSLTMAPEVAQRHVDILRRYERRQGFDFDEHPEDVRFRLRAKMLGREATLFLKRLRKQVGKFRYMLVTEAHQSGVPHLHCLIFEASNECLIRKKQLQAAWTVGFSNFKLKDADVAYYICDYIKKSLLSRVRASINFGKL